ncbi:ATP-binding response regulator [Sediminitomix flava]|uniref:histidine kinase n=1 Tax=Sediminitomix flava TaxID=379075 RepID=A0A315ZAY4_SEDFL|nr:ATP-binding protein [Sediminitomix flava]PWJ42213.1 signal transduction histidine kinase [Sediminitomix flava]
MKYAQDINTLIEEIEELKTENELLKKNNNSGQSLQMKISELEQEVKSTVVEKNRYISVITHELRTPLNAIIGMAHLLESKSPRDDQKELIDTLVYSSNKLLSLINDTLDLSKLEAGMLQLESKSFNIYQLIEQTQKLFEPKAKDKQIRFFTFIDSNIPQNIKGDETRLSQILNNIVSNAIKFTEQGEVCIMVKLVERKENTIILEFEIKDSGIGIPQDMQGQIFEPFRQAEKSTFRKFGGTGLGLSITKNLVEFHNGTLDLKSKEAEGTTFIIKLPYDLEEEKEEIVSDESENQSSEEFKDLSVLYVEDIGPNQFLMKGFCSNWGIKLDIASEGEECMKLLESNIYDVILMDIRMPGKDGYEVSKDIRMLDSEFAKNVPIYAVTANTYEHSKNKYEEAGMNGYLPKPIDPDKLKDIFILHNEDKKKQATKVETPKQNDVDIFSTLDVLFIDNKEDYRVLLSLMLKEFDGYENDLLTAITNKDLDVISFIRHSMKSTLETLNQKLIINKLNQVDRDELNKTDLIQLQNEVKEQLIQLKGLIRNKIEILNEVGTIV